MGRPNARCNGADLRMRAAAACLSSSMRCRGMWVPIHCGNACSFFSSAAAMTCRASAGIAVDIGVRSNFSSDLVAKLQSWTRICWQSRLQGRQGDSTCLSEQAQCEPLPKQASFSGLQPLISSPWLVHNWSFMAVQSDFLDLAVLERDFRGTEPCFLLLVYNQSSDKCLLRGGRFSFFVRGTLYA